MNELTTDVIERIDALLHACAWCGNGLGTSPSPDFCSEACQRAWHTRSCADDESGGPTTARARLRTTTDHAGEVFVSWPRQQPIPPDWLLDIDEQAQPRVELYEPPEAPADLPASVRPGPRLRVQPADRDNPFWTPLRKAHLVCWDIPRVRASAALWELLEDLRPAAQRVYAGLSVHNELGQPQHRLTTAAQQARREIAAHLQRELANWSRIEASASTSQEDQA